MPRQEPQHWRRGWTESERNRWWERIEHLLDALSIDKPVQVRRVRMKRCHGECQYWDKFYRIRIDNTLGYQMAVLILLHELAHALEPNDDHGPAFHMAQFEVWLAYNEYELDDA